MEGEDLDNYLESMESEIHKDILWIIYFINMKEGVEKIKILKRIVLNELKERTKHIREPLDTIDYWKYAEQVTYSVTEDFSNHDHDYDLHCNSKLATGRKFEWGIRIIWCPGF